MGSFSYEALYVDDTILWDPVNGISSTFAGYAQVAFYEPGAAVTLFPVNVDQSIEVNGQELPDGTGDTNFGDGVPGPVVGPFISNPAATPASIRR